MVGDLVTSLNALLDNYFYVLGEASDLSQNLSQYLDRTSLASLEFSNEICRQASSSEDIANNIVEAASIALVLNSRLEQQ
jgi:hypothetical protein